jgi:hypothetical protein
MGLQNLLRQIRAELEIDLAERARERDYPSGLEPGFKHPQAGGYMLVRDDAVTEMGNGPNTAVIADGANQQVTVKANAISLHSRYLHFHTEPNGLYFGYQRLNPFWFSLPGDLVSPFWKAPIIPLAPGMWETLATIPFLTGSITSPVPVFLSNFLRPMPLFGPNEQLLILSRNLAQMMRSLGIPG